MKNVIALVPVLFFLAGFGQQDSSKIYLCTTLKKGFYLSYNEFMANAPSVTIPFDVIYYTRSNKDTTIMGASYKLTGEEKLSTEVWGFCDGKDVYIEYSHGFRQRFWKLECLGPYPFFSSLQKNVVAIGGLPMALVTTAITVSQPAQLDCRVITPDAKYREPSARLLRKWMASDPELLADFKIVYERVLEEDWLTRQRLLREYLFKLNERLVSKSRQP